MIREAIDRVAERYAAGEYQAEAVRARAQYRELTGRILADGAEGDTLERELQTFLEWYVLDRPLDGQLPILRFLADGDELREQESAVLRGLAHSHRSVFEIAALRDGEVHLMDLVLGGRWRVHERREMVAIARDDVIEARLVPYDGKMLFSESFLVHPPAARFAIVALIERLRGKNLGFEEILLELGRRWLRAQHYRNVALERIYLD